MAFELVGIAICVLLSALFSGSETALTALGSTGGQKLLEDDPKGHRLMRIWVERPFRSLTAILVGNNVVNITASALATSVAFELVGQETDASTAGPAIAATVGVMTFLILTFGEVTPKILSKAFSTRLAKQAIRFVAVSYYLFWPINALYAKLVRLGLKATGADPAAEQVTMDDIEFMVNLGTRDGTLDADRERLLISVFEYGDTTVKEVMVPRVDVVTVPHDANWREVLQLLVEAGHSRIPVYEDNVDNIVGLFHAKDLLAFLLGDSQPDSFSLKDYLREPMFVPISKKVDQMLAEFRECRTHMAVVVDEFGGTAGVVTLEDIIEEFFGEIQDEFDQEEPLLRGEANGLLIADARISLDELTDALGLEFPEDHDYESLGGFISEQVGSVPEAGSQLTYQDFVFTVRSSEPTHVVSVAIERPNTPTSEEAVVEAARVDTDIRSS